MEKVVDILGAGFSAPLGIPVTRTFLSKSKDLYASNPDQYSDFRTVFNTIREMSVTKNYFEADLFNIEEILSILEMGRNLEGIHKRELFVNYICGVISHYTPKAQPPPGQFSSNWGASLFRGYSYVDLFGFFVCALFGLQIQDNFVAAPGKFLFQRMDNPPAHYTIVTLNYDVVLECIVKYLNEISCPNNHLAFIRDPSRHSLGPQVTTVNLAKLHGSVDDQSVVPPTWNKGLADENILVSWKLAFTSLQEANHIRMIGYSLPQADSYVKYLLKAAVTRSDNLKTIDVLCLDDQNGNVKQRFDDFIHFRDYRFRSGDVRDYLTRHRNRYYDLESPNKPLRFGLLEEMHEQFFSNP